MPSAATIAGLLGGAEILGIDLLNPDPADWMIVDAATSELVIKPDTVERFSYRNESNVSDYPVEQGAFASYNKVATPYDIRMTLICSGLNLVQKGVNALGLNDLLGNVQNQPMERSSFLDTLESMLDSLDLYDIVTPDKTYTNCNLVHYDYQRRARNGVKLLAVDCAFREIRLTTSATYSSSSTGLSVNSNSPSAASQVNTGSVVTYALGTQPANIGVFQ